MSAQDRHKGKRRASEPVQHAPNLAEPVAGEGEPIAGDALNDECKRAEEAVPRSQGHHRSLSDASRPGRTITHGRSLPTLPGLGPGDHVCHLYETDEEQRAVLMPFLRQGLERGEKVLYIVDAHAAEAVLGYLRDDGLDVEPYLTREQLAILTRDDAYMRQGRFDPDEMIAFLRAETERALAEGYPALRVTGEMTWALRGLPGSERLIEYEARLNKFFPGSNCLAICQYDQRAFDPALLLDVLHTHPAAAVGTAVYNNFYHVATSELADHHSHAARLRRRVGHLAERRRAEEARRDGEERFRHVLDSCRDMVYRLNLKTFTYDYVSPSCREVLGYSPEEFAALGFMGAGSLVHPDDVQRVLENFAQLRTHPTVEYRFRHKELGYRWMSDSRSVVFDDKGGAAVVGALRDITERKRAEAAYRTLVDHSLQGLVILQDGRFVFANQAYAKMTGYTVEELLSLSPEEVQAIVHPQDRARAWSRHEDRLQGRPLPGRHEFRGIRKDGTTFVLESHGSLIEYQGRPAVQAVAIDITERKRAEEALQNLATFPGENPNPIIRVARNGTVVFANETSRPLLELWGTAAGASLPPEPYQQVESALTAGKLVTGETVCGDRTFLVICAPIAERDYVNIYGVDITKRKRAEEALRESEERFRLIARATSDVIWDWDLRTGRLWRSEGVQTLFGYAPSEEGPKVTWWYERVHPEDRERASSGNYTAISGGGESWVNEYRFRRADGSYAHVQERSYILRDGDGRPARLIGGMTDITERKRAEQALQESERRYRLLAENARDVIWTVDPNLRTTYISPSVTHLWGYSVEEVVTRTVDQMLTPASLDVAMEALVEELAAESTGQSDPSRSRTLELESVCRDGSTIWTEAKMSALRDERGRLVGILGVSRDISERRRVHKALEESERRYRLLAENATDIIWIRDLELRGLYVNPAVTRIRGYTVEEAMTQTPEEILTPASLELVREALAEELAKEQVEKRDLYWWRILELENICKDGSTVWLEEKVMALRDEDKRIVGILGISRDISERRRAEEALQEAREELESRVDRRMRRGNAYGLTFRELTVLHLVVAGKSDKEIASVLGISTLTASKHLANILHKMGAASRTEAGVRAVREALLD